MSLSSVLAKVPAELVADVAALVESIVSQHDIGAALERAKAAVVSDAADAATDAALRRTLQQMEP